MRPSTIASPPVQPIVSSASGAGSVSTTYEPKFVRLRDAGRQALSAAFVASTICGALRMPVGVVSSWPRIRGQELTTPTGILSAPQIVLATNAALSAWRPASRSLTNFGSYVVLTEPAPEALETIGWTGGEAIVDGRMFLHYFRTTSEGRVLMGSGSGPIGFAGRIDDRFSLDGPTTARAEAGLRRLLPGLGGARIERAWGGPIDVSSDHLPFFGTKPGTRIHYGAGYSGHGVGPSWLGGRILASLALDADDEWTRLPLVTRRVPTLPPEPLRRIGGGLVRSAIMACETAEEQGRRPPLAARAGAALPRLIGMELGTR